MAIRPRRPPRGGGVDRKQRGVDALGGGSGGAERAAARPDGGGGGSSSPTRRRRPRHRLLGPPLAACRRGVAAAAAAAPLLRDLASSRRRRPARLLPAVAELAALLLAALSAVVVLLSAASLIRSNLHERALNNYLSTAASSSSGGFRYDRHPPSRADRFPTVEERVRMYMGDWYRVPCDEEDGDADAGGDDATAASAAGGVVRYRYGPVGKRVGDGTRDVDAASVTLEYFDPVAAGDTGTSTSTLILTPNIRPDSVLRLSPSRLADCALRPYRVFLKTCVTHGLLRMLNGPPPDFGLEMRSNMRSYCVDAADFGVIAEWLMTEEAADGDEGAAEARTDAGGGSGGGRKDDDFARKLGRWAASQSKRGIGAALKRAALRRLDKNHGRSDPNWRPGGVRRRADRGGKKGAEGGGGYKDVAPRFPPPIVAQFGDHPVPRIARVAALGDGDKETGARSGEEDPLPFPLFMKFRPASGAFVPHRLRVSSHSDDSASSAAAGVGDAGGVEESCLPPSASRPRRVYPSPPSSGTNLLRYGPVLWRLESHRHYNFLRHVPYWDTPWEDKLNAAAWRGGLTGFRHRELDALPPEERARLTDEDICTRYSERCRLVLSAAKARSVRPVSEGGEATTLASASGEAPLVDAGLTFLAPQGTNGYELPVEIGEASLLKPSLSIPQLLRYKALISLQGNDVASGLKWSLFSKSVVLMPPPTVSSWAMEEALVPWVHYVPLSREKEGEGGSGKGGGVDADAVEEAVAWVLRNEDRARSIAERATLWMWDMFFHEDAAGDEVRIKEDILMRYGRHFRPAARLVGEK